MQVLQGGVRGPKSVYMCERKWGHLNEQCDTVNLIGTLFALKIDVET